jgi:hypothetical protein
MNDLTIISNTLYTNEKLDEVNGLENNYLAIIESNKKFRNAYLSVATLLLKLGDSEKAK